MRGTLALLLVALVGCTTTTNVRLLPDRDTGNIETLWKNQTIASGNKFSVEISDSIFVDRSITFLKDGRPIAKKEFEKTLSIPVLLLGWLAFGIPYIWLTPAKETQTFDLTPYLSESGKQ